MAVFVNIIYSIMAKKESKILEELRRKGERAKSLKTQLHKMAALLDV